LRPGAQAPETTTFAALSTGFAAFRESFSVCGCARSASRSTPEKAANVAAESPTTAALGMRLRCAALPAALTASSDTLENHHAVIFKSPMSGPNTAVTAIGRGADSR